MSDKKTTRRKSTTKKAKEEKIELLVDEPLVQELEQTVIKDAAATFASKLEGASNYKLLYRGKLVSDGSKPVKALTDGVIVDNVKYPYAGLELKIHD